MPTLLVTSLLEVTTYKDKQNENKLPLDTWSNIKNGVGVRSSKTMLQAGQEKLSKGGLDRFVCLQTLCSVYCLLLAKARPCYRLMKL